MICFIILLKWVWIWFSDVGLWIICLNVLVVSDNDFDVVEVVMILCLSICFWDNIMYLGFFLVFLLLLLVRVIVVNSKVSSMVNMLSKLCVLVSNVNCDVFIIFFLVILMIE